MQPIVRFLIPCWKEPTIAAGGPNAHEIMYAIQPKHGHSYPLWQRPFYLLALITNVHGVCRLQIELHLEELDQDVLVQTTDSLAIDLGNDPLRVQPVSIMMKAAKLPRPGVYRLNLTSDSETRGRCHNSCKVSHMENHDSGCDSEGICAPMVRCTTTFRTTSQFKYLENVPGGDSEPSPMEPIAAVSPCDPIVQLELLFLRPRMFCSEIGSLRDVLLVARGICLGHVPPGGHAFEGEAELTNFINARFSQPSRLPWTVVLLNELSGQPYLEACERIAQVLRDWRASRAD